MSRITPGTVIVGIFAVLFGLVGAYGARKYLQGEKPLPPPSSGPQTLIVPMASDDLDPGRTIVLGNVALVRLTPQQIDRMCKEGKLPEQYMTNPQQIIGRMLKNPLKKGEAFRTEDLYAEGSGPTIAEKLAPGLRAVTIPVDGTGALGGYDGPGSYVDVVFKTDPDAQAGIPETTVTLLEGVQVLAMEVSDRRAPPGTRLENRVTLAVTADQANALKIAEGRGTFALSLRNPDDVEVAASTIPQTLDRLLNLPVASQHVTAIFRGGNPTQTAAFQSEPVASPPAVSLPVAGVLQLRAAQQATSVDAEPASVDEAEPAVPVEPPPAKPVAPAAPRATLPAKATISASPRLQGPPADKQPAPVGMPDTVTVQIPVSVLLGGGNLATGLASAYGSPQGPPRGPASQSSAEPAFVPGVTAATAGDSTEPSRSSRQRKMLSDIGKNYWDWTSNRGTRK